MASTYRSPGVYITEVPNPALSGLPAGFRLPGLVATGKTTLPVKNIAVTKGAANGTDTIPTTYTVSNITAVGDVPDLQQYVENVDWRQVVGTIVWISGGQQPTTGAAYYVSLNRPKVTADYLPTLFTSLKDIRDTYGNELDAGIVNVIPTAAKLMFDNGAPGVVIAQATTGSQTDLQTAIDNMRSQDIDILVVPQATNTTLTQYVRTHVLSQSAPSIRHERIFISGADGLSDATTTIANKAITYSSERMWVVSPPSFVTTLRDATYETDQDVLLTSNFVAAAYAGVATNPNFDAASPLTRKSLVGPKNLSTHNYLETDKDYLAQNGVTVVETGVGGFRVRHAVTSDNTNVNTFTASVILIKDHLRKTLRPLLDRTYIGTKITSRTPAEVSATVIAYLEQKITDQIIVSYRNISVTQDASDPRTINVKFDVKPVYPLEFVDVSFSLVVS